MSRTVRTAVKMKRMTQKRMKKRRRKRRPMKKEKKICVCH